MTYADGLDIENYASYWQTDCLWQEACNHVLRKGAEVAPSGIQTKEVLGFGFDVPIRWPVISVESRKMNYAFMFAEAAWIVGGSNRLEDLTPYLKDYARYSDDGEFLAGAYGPKFVDQLPYILSCLGKDTVSRQAVLSIWRERPGVSKDVPCTLTHQYFIRNGKLDVVANMRSQDMVWGCCYDMFTFSCMAWAVIHLLRERKRIWVDPGTLMLRYGSAHVYERHWEKAKEWLSDVEVDRRSQLVREQMDRLTHEGMTYPSFVKLLRESADRMLAEKLG